MQHNNFPKVSIIIPCYNHGKYIDEALQSIEQIPDKALYEIIIINDGSTDPYTNERLKQLSEAGYHVIFQPNSGLARTRNNGIRASKGTYILPLDADNKIRPEYVLKGIELLENEPGISVVYGNAALFGEKTGTLEPGSYNLQRLMLGNYIDACAIYRKTVWEHTGGYDFNMPAQGVEDWELWLHASFLGYRFKYVDEILFDYRILGSSMIHELRKSKINNDRITDYLITKHAAHFGPQFIDENIMSKFATSPLGFMGKLFLKKYLPGVFRKKVLNGSLRKYI